MGDTKSMPYDKALARLMSMSDEVWERHSNPWSGWTRLALFPLWFLAIWSRVWIGWWALLPIAVLLICTWLNPRVFPRHTDDRSWMTRAVLGERMFIERRIRPIPPDDVRTGHVLNILALAALGVALYGFLRAHFAFALAGWLFAGFFKILFVARMARLYSRTKQEGGGRGNELRRRQRDA